MVKTPTKLQAVIRRRGLSTMELAGAAGITVGTLHNLACGSSNTKKARQKITDLLGEQIWPDVGISGHLMRIPAGAEIEFETPDQALEVGSTFGANVTIEGKSIRFALPTRLVIQFPISTNLGAPAISASRSSTESPQQQKQGKKK